VTSTGLGLADLRSHEGSVQHTFPFHGFDLRKVSRLQVRRSPYSTQGGSMSMSYWITIVASSSHFSVEEKHMYGSQLYIHPTHTGHVACLFLQPVKSSLMVQAPSMLFPTISSTSMRNVTLGTKKSRRYLLSWRLVRSILVCIGRRQARSR
jgi:hypothetical protein